MPKLNFKSIFFIIFLLLSLTLTNKAQQNRDEDTIKIDTVLLNIPVIVSDRNGRNISGLKKENFTITQNGEKQNIDFFADEDSPMNVAIVIDLSGSTRKVLADIKAAAGEFIKILRPEDKAMIVGFNNDVKVLCRLTSDQKNLDEALNKADIAVPGGSRMQDAIYQVITKEFASVKGKKAIIVLTDGFVEGYVSNEKLLNTVIESDTLIYPIFFQTDPLLADKVKALTIEQLVTVPPINYLNSLALATAGRFFAADSTKFTSAFQSIADELKKQYLLGFYPLDSKTGKSAEFKIKINQENLIIRTKKSFRLKVSHQNKQK